MSKSKPVREGDRVKTWTILRRAHFDRFERPCWLLRCDCGNERFSYDQHIRSTPKCYLCQNGPIPSYLHA